MTRISELFRINHDYDNRKQRKAVKEKEVSPSNKRKSTAKHEGTKKLCQMQASQLLKSSQQYVDLNKKIIASGDEVKEKLGVKKIDKQGRRQMEKEAIDETLAELLARHETRRVKTNYQSKIPVDWMTAASIKRVDNDSNWIIPQEREPNMREGSSLYLHHWPSHQQWIK